jgi:hypothetical protein
MRTRRTAVAWDPTLLRVEYLDDRGDPYYCTFERCDGDIQRAPWPAGIPAPAAVRVRIAVKIQRRVHR